MTDEARFTDVGNARRLVAMHGDKIRYVGEWGAWLSWERTHWRRDHSGQVYELAKHVVADLFATAEDKDARAWAHKSEDARRLEAMVRLARTDSRVAVGPDDLDGDPYALNLRNGTLNLRTGQLHPHDPQELHTKVAGTSYDPDAEYPLFEKFLERVIPDEDTRELLARWAGYSLTGDVSEHKVLFAVGSGMNGKGTLVRALATVLGAYAGEGAPDLLMRRFDEPHPTGLADLQGRRLVFLTESAQNRRLDEALLKRLTGGDTIKARYMHRDFFEFRPSHKFLVSTNHLPTIDGTDYGIWRRVRQVPFSVTIPEDERDLKLDDKLATEAPGILRWAVQGCARWRCDGLRESTEVMMATADYRAEMDVIGRFISDECVLISGLSIRANALYDAYKQWCETEGMARPMTQTMFGRCLRERGLKSRKSGMKMWDGIALLARSDDGGPADDPRYEQRRLDLE